MRDGPGVRLKTRDTHVAEEPETPVMAYIHSGGVRYHCVAPCRRTAGGLLEDCQSIEEESSLAEEEVACVSMSGARLSFFRAQLQRCALHTHGQVADSTLSVFDLERGSGISREWDSGR